MSFFDTLHLSTVSAQTAPDGSHVHALLRLDSASMAHFELDVGQTSQAIMHQTVDEIWFILTGQGKMWRQQNEHEKIIVLMPGICLTIPRGVRFQFKSSDSQSITAIGITTPPWPGDNEAILVTGPWQPTVGHMI